LEYLCLLGMVSFGHHTYMWMALNVGSSLHYMGLLVVVPTSQLGFKCMHWVFESLKLLLLNMIIFFVVSEWVKPPMENEQSFKNIT
jgi:hypothetical protein